MRLHFFNSAVIANSKMDYYTLRGLEEGREFPDLLHGITCMQSSVEKQL